MIERFAENIFGHVANTVGNSWQPDQHIGKFALRGNGMKRSLVAILFSLVILGLAQVSFADEDFYGIVESRPDGVVGTWIIGGRTVEATEMTELDEDYGPIKVGTCVEVDIDNGKVEEIESEPPHKCRKRK